jgi:predicted O-methyltransferase YrrM
MNDTIVRNKPEIHSAILNKSGEIGFSMPSDDYVGSLLRTLVSSKPKGRFLELGTGIGLSLSWIADGMDEEATLVTIDNDPYLTDLAYDYFGKDPRIEIINRDASDWIRENSEKKFDLIFVDALPGKYSLIEETLKMLRTGGFYVVDDMSRQPNWPEGHQARVTELIVFLENRKDFNLTKLDWSTGLIVAVKK